MRMRQQQTPVPVPGESKLYIVEYLSGGGALGVDDSTDLEGSPSATFKDNWSGGSF